LSHQPHRSVTTVETGTLQLNGDTTPAATIAALLKTRYNSGSATHFNTGKFQSTTADSHLGLGWRDSAAAQQVMVAYALYGDANGDGTVAISDLAFLGASWNGTGKNWAQGDFNYDGKVALSDLGFLGANWNQSIPGFSQVVPEPGTLVLLIAGLLGLAASAWRR